MESDHADHLREKNSDRDPDQQRGKAVPDILRKKEKEESAPLHPEHQQDAEFIFSSLELIQSGKIYKEKQKKQGYSVEHRKHCEQLLHGVAFHSP